MPYGALYIQNNPFLGQICPFLNVSEGNQTVFGRRIWKPWTIEVVGEYSGNRAQMTFWRFWSEGQAEIKAFELNKRDVEQGLDTGTHFEAARLR